MSRAAPRGVDAVAAAGGSAVLLPHFVPHADGLQTVGGRLIALEDAERELAAHCAQERPLADLASLPPGTRAALARLLSAAYLVRLPPVSPDPPSGARDVVLSPHVDDAALSLGGWVAARRGASAAPLVVNVFSVQSYQTGLRVPPDRLDAIAQAEERLAARILGYDSRSLGLVGAQDRRGLSLARTMGWSVADVLADERHRGDLDQVVGRIAAAIAAAAPDRAIGRLFAPAAIGGHLDHVIVALAALRLAAEHDVASDRVILYEDLPYAAGRMGGGIALAGCTSRLEWFTEVVADKQAALSVFKTRLRDPQVALCIAHARELAGGDGYAERRFVRDEPRSDARSRRQSQIVGAQVA
jgi:LmbE family N-acetylglucosaminyl deacetylase